MKVAEETKFKACDELNSKSGTKDGENNIYKFC